MLVLIIGGSGSGKSAYAENYIAGIPGMERKYYLATMKVYDKEAEKRVLKHREMRSGKGFYTIEQCCDIQLASQSMDAWERENCEETKPDQRAALLECMSNLVANEMFREDKICPGALVEEKILREIRMLENTVGALVIVTNNVFEDGTEYDGTTMEYIRTLGAVNEKLSDRARQVIEVVAGIPVLLKEEK